MKFFYSFALLFCSLYVYAQDCNIGNETPTEDFVEGLFGPNYLLGTSFTLEEEGTLLSINLIGNNSGSPVRMAVYDNFFGMPNDLVTTSAGAGVVGQGLVSLPTVPIVLQPGDYWIMAVYPEEGNHSLGNLSAATNISCYIEHQYNAPFPDNVLDCIPYPGQDFLYFLEIECSEGSSIQFIEKGVSSTVYPNPSSDYIQVAGLKRSMNFQIFSLTGAVVKSGVVSDNEEIDIRDLNAGDYFLKLDNGIASRFIKL